MTNDAILDAAQRGRAFEIMIGGELARWDNQLCYWREGNQEVDFVLHSGNKVAAIEVKSAKMTLRGLEKFKTQFKTAELFLVTPENFTKVLGEIYSFIFES